jgi:hypothetical protein
LPACSRRHGTWLEEKNIEIPGGVITGPDLSVENRDFIALVTVNNFDKVRQKQKFFSFLYKFTVIFSVSVKTN